MKGEIQYILFDAANTLIHKPLLWERFQGVLKRSGYLIPDEVLKKNHKLLSEAIHFPDRTSGDFYRKFNAEVLYSVGIIPTMKILDEIFEACTYLDWIKFEDTEVLSGFHVPVGILSNFNSSLEKKVSDLFGPVFSHVITSEVQGVGKPDERFYQHALDRIGLAANHILYVGDSIKLDMEPAQNLGFRTFLIDRDNIFPFFSRRIESLKQIPEIIIQ